MKKPILQFAVTALLLLLASCAKYYPESVFLDLSVSQQKAAIYDGSRAASITGYDNRADRALILYQLGDENIQLPCTDPPQKLLVQNLTEGFSSQGLIFSDSGKIRIDIEIDEMAVNVNKGKWTYDTVAATRLQIKVSKPQGTFTKRLNREAEQTSFFRPDLEELEKMLGTQVSELIEAILSDKGIADAIRE